MPKIAHIFDECEWMPFVSASNPRVDTWDGEDRANAIKNGFGKKVCGSELFSAMYIDARTKGGDIPWDETGEAITKVTPW